MANFNKVLLIGNLTRDPVLRTTSSGFSICEFGLAVNRRFKNKQGEEKSDVCFIDVSCLGRLADAANRYLHKGYPVYIEGRLKFESRVDPATRKNISRLSVIGESMQFLRFPPDRQAPPDATPPPQYPGAARTQTPPQPQQQPPMQPPPCPPVSAPLPAAEPLPQPQAFGRPAMPPPAPDAAADDNFYEDLPF